MYWRRGAEKLLLGLKSSDGFLHIQLANAFSVLDSPVWMDSSTGDECVKLEQAVGGAHALAEITGELSPYLVRYFMFARFVGSQLHYGQ